MQGVFNPNIPIYVYHPPNSAEGLHFSAFHYIPVVECSVPTVLLFLSSLHSPCLTSLLFYLLSAIFLSFLSILFLSPNLYSLPISPPFSLTLLIFFPSLHRSLPQFFPSFLTSSLSLLPSLTPLILPALPQSFFLVLPLFIPPSLPLSLHLSLPSSLPPLLPR